MTTQDSKQDSQTEHYTIDYSFIMKTILSNRKKIIGYSFGIAIVVAGLSLLMSNKYTSTSTILPSSGSSSLSQYSSIANLVGITLPDLNSSEGNDQLYPEILTSEKLLSGLINKKWKHVDFDSLVTLYDIFKIELDTDAAFPERKRKEVLLRAFRESIISSSIDKITGIITINVVVSSDPSFACELHKELLKQLDNYNRNFRKTKSLEQKLFLDKRLSEAINELTKSENDLKDFEESFKNWNQSPELNLKWARLNREVQVNTSIWIELRKQYEITKLELEKEKITFDVLDDPQIPSLKSSPKRGIIVISFFVFSLIATSSYFGFKPYIVDKWQLFQKSIK